MHACRVKRTDELPYRSVRLKQVYQWRIQEFQNGLVGGGGGGGAGGIKLWGGGGVKKGVFVCLRVGV